MKTGILTAVHTAYIEAGLPANGPIIKGEDIYDV